MPLELIGVGFGRTGTDSTRTALNALGLPCYHMLEVLDNPANRPAHLNFWWRVGQAPAGQQHDWEQVFANYRATVDCPAACVWQELLAAYPGAKVLLTLHPGGPDAWYDSTWETIHLPQRQWQAKVVAMVVPFARRIREMTGTLVWDRFLHNTMGDRDAAIARYQQHIDQVRAAVPPDRLLVYQVSDGWQPLCEFLGLPAPDTSFPRVNDRASMLRRIRLLGYAVWPILLTPVALLGLAGWWLLGS